MEGSDSSKSPKEGLGWKSLQHFVDEHRQLLKQERDAEHEEASRLTEGVPIHMLEKRGVALAKMKIAETSTGFYGRTVFKFTSARGGPQGGMPLPSSKIKAGDILGVCLVQGNALKQYVSGVVSRISDLYVNLACEHTPDDPLIGNNFVLLKLGNDITYKRLTNTLDQLTKRILEQKEDCPVIPVVRALFDGSLQDRLPHPSPAKNITFINPGLNESQQEAVNFCMGQENPISIIHGPPGTGKTTTVVELIYQLARSGSRILAAAPSNIAVDNLVERLARYNDISVVRVGHPARLMDSVKHLSLDARVDASEEAGLVRDIRQEMTAIHSKLQAANSGSRHALRSEFKELRKELRVREKDAVRAALKDAHVVLGTLTSIAPDGPIGYLSKKYFDVCIIDESGQAMEIACWTALMHAPRCVLAGDHLQLPPTISCKNSEVSSKLSYTLLERCVDVLGDKYVRLLDTQYRMHKDIMQWSSDTFYNSCLKADVSVQDHTLAQMEGVLSTETTETPVCFVDTAGCGLDESTGDGDLGDLSKCNPGEAELVRNHVAELVEANVQQDQIGVITPYNAQVDLLREMLRSDFPKVEIHSVDGFQGREKDAIIISMVRCNAKRIVGFLAEARRMNVAITRARRHLTVIADSVTVSSDKILAGLIDYLSSSGSVSSAFEYTNEMVTVGNANLSGQQQKEMQKKERTTKQKSKAEDDKDGITRRQQYYTLLLEFKNDTDKLEYNFPSELNSFERKLVHEVAEELDLFHSSDGHGKKRNIVIWKQGARKEEINKNEENKNEDEEETPHAPVDLEEFQTVDRGHEETINPMPEPQQNGVTCLYCKKELPKGNSELHILRCEREQKRKARAHAANDTLADTKNKPSKTKSRHVSKGNRLGGTKMKESGQKETEEEVDALLDFMADKMKRCQASDCRVNVELMGELCGHCQKKYCYQHCLPEVHGCGDAARHTRRSTAASKPRELTGNAKMRHEQLQRRLKHAVEEKAANRTTKTKKGKSKKK
eukprot:m.274218 g.274218  ORF g.274218 m.274218 type:complete len:1007 (-) comp16286_c0_seq6:4357-7377(-)